MATRGMQKLSRFIEAALIVLMAVVLLLLITLPWSITWVTERTHDDPFYIRYLVILGYSGIMAELVLWQSRGIMHNVNRGCVFSADTVRRMRTLAVECMILAVFYLATMFWMSKFFMAALFVVFVLFGCVLLVFAELFRQANEYKAENDMTI